jgi:hypothetical protein
MSAARAFSPAAGRQPVEHAGGDGQHVLHRAADLDADDVGGGVDAQRIAVQGLDSGAGQVGVFAGRHQRRGLAARHLEREAGAGQHAAGQTGPHGAPTSWPSKPVPASKPLHNHSAGLPSGRPASCSRRPAIGVAMTADPPRHGQRPCRSAVTAAPAGKVTSGR